MFLEQDGGCFAQSQEKNNDRIFEYAYRVAQLGVCAVHHLLAALSIYYGISDYKTILCCDNLGAINVLRRRLRRIRPSMSCTDILRNIRSARNKMTTNSNYDHVCGHMHDYLLGHQLTLEQKMNKIRDLFSKGCS